MPLDHSLAWWQLPIVVFDFETTGVDVTTCMPVSVAAVRFEQGVERAAFSALLQPGIPIPEAASAIHGITDEKVRDAPELAAYAGELAAVALDAVPCGYNGEAFDKPILHRFISGTDCPLFDPAQAWLDPLVIVRKLDRFVAGTGRHKLATACARWGVPIPDGEAHSALGDVRAVGRLLARLVELGKVRTDVTLERVLAYTAIQRARQERDFQNYRARRAPPEKPPCPQT